MVRRRGFPARSRRPVTWGQGPIDAGATISATGKTLWSSAVSLQVEAEATIVRTRGAGQFILKTASAAGDGFAVGVGFAVVTEVAHTLGVTALPGPLTDIDWDGWLFHAVGFIQAITATLADGVNGPIASLRYVIDSKGMRKWDAGAEVLVAMIEVTELGTASMEHNGDSRVLIKT